MQYSNEELAKYAGETQKIVRLNLDSVSLHGTKGKFLKSKFVKKGEYSEEDLGTEFEGVILRVRRKLAAYDRKTKTTHWTSEHNTKKDFVTLFKKVGDAPREVVDQGTAEELRTKHENLDLKTNQVLYVMQADGSLVNVIVKGASLSQENKPKGVHSFYEYLSSFPEGEHVWQYKTKFVPIEETSQMGSYWCLSFVSAEKLEEPMMMEVSKNLKKIYDAITASDEEAQNTKSIASKSAAMKVEQDKIDDGDSPVDKELPTIDLDTDKEIKAEDLPF